MIKARQGNLIILGLSDENLTRLQNGEPITFNLQELGLFPNDVLIFHGKTEEEMKKEMFELGLINPTKTIIKDANAKNN